MKITLICLTILFFSPLSDFSKTQKKPISATEISEMIAAHNKWRTDVKVPPLEWSDELSYSAEKWAKQLKKDCGFQHSKSGYGENLWKGSTGFYSITEVVDSWGSEINDYNYSKNKCKPGKVCGHYTQVVWSTTTKVGCAKMECNGFTTWVCQYDPPGNWVGKKPY